MRPKARESVLDLEVADVEVGGDVHRIILSGIKAPKGPSALDSRAQLLDDYDELRRLLISYPYGTEDMCADFVFASAHADAAHGYVIMESMGYPYYSGSNTIATIAALHEYGIVPSAEGESDIALEAPGGIVKGRYGVRDGLIQEVSVSGDGAYVISERETVDVPGMGPVSYALVWCGAYFIMVKAGDVGIALDPAHIPAMKRIGRALTDAIAETFSYEHRTFGRIDPPRFVHFTGPCEKLGAKHYRGRGATYGYPATVYHCPTGTGTSARMALMTLRNETEDDAIFENVSAMGNMFTGRALGMEGIGGNDALRTNITARPYVLATVQIHIDFDNPLMRDYARLRDIMG